MNFSRYWFKRRARHGFALLALLALSLVIARPICDAYSASGGTAQPVQVEASDHSGHDHSRDGEPGPCCSSIDDASLLSSAVTVPAAAQPSAFVLVAAGSLQPWSAVADRRIALEPPDRPPLSRSYQARTARLLI